MLTFLDLLIIVVLALVAVSLLAVALMFLVKNEKVKKVCFYIVASLGVYLGYVGVRVQPLDYMGQALLALMLAIVSIGSVVMHLRKKDDAKVFRYAQIAASVALIAGVCNAFFF